MVSLDDSVVILEQVEDNCLHNKEIRFLVESLNGNLLDERTMRMKEENEWLRFTQDEGEIYLKGWECRRAQHTLKKTYGLLFAAVVPWDTYKIPVNIVSVVDKVDIKALPMYVSTGDGPGFMVNNRVFNIFRDQVKDKRRRGVWEWGRDCCSTAWSTRVTTPG